MRRNNRGMMRRKANLTPRPPFYCMERECTRTFIPSFAGITDAIYRVPTRNNMRERITHMPFACQSNRVTSCLILLTLICLLVSATGCQSTGTPNVTYVVITGESPQQTVGQIQQETPTITPIPPSPTPEIAPEVALQIADRYLLDGYYENAVFSYQAILNRGESAPPEIRAAAAYGLGQAALREGLFQNAVDALTILMTQFPGDFRAAQALFLRGDAYLGLSQWQAAINDFQQYLALRPGLIDSYAYERIGDAQIALGQFDAAFASYEQATTATRSSVPLLALREKVARVYLLAGQVEMAVAQYDAILAAAQSPAYLAQIEFAAGETLLNSGNTEAGIARMRRIVLQYETQPEAYRAMTILQANNVALDSYRRGRVAYFYGDYDTAIEAFNTFTTETLLEDIPAELHLLLGRAYRQVGNPGAAVVAFQTVIEQYPTDPLFGEALLEQGRTRFLEGDIEAAIERYLQIGETYHYLPETAAEALWRAGYLYGTQQNYAESRRIFEVLAERYPNSTQATSGLFIAATAAINNGETGAAEQLYSRLATMTTGENRADAYLQLGRMAQQRGDVNAAQQAFNQVVVAAPDSYYAARAQDLLVGRAPFTPPSRYIFQFDDLADVTAAENWIRQTFGVNQEGPLWPLAPELEVEPRIVRGRELWAVGQFQEAETEFYDILDDYKANGLTSYQLSIFFRILGSYTPSMQGAANVITAAGIGTLDAPAYIARLRYPVYYRDLVLREAEQYGFDPLLLFSLIRHETLFNTHAQGAAGEVGLTQVIPSTGEYIGGQLRIPNYEHRDLARPYMGIAFGAYYLSEQLNRFGGNVYAGLAGYNAGPGRAQQWLELSGGDPDLFMSTITIDSVRMYIQLNYRNYNIYRALYGA